MPVKSLSNCTVRAAMSSSSWGDKVGIAWVDNKGDKRSDEATVT